MRFCWGWISSLGRGVSEMSVSPTEQRDKECDLWQNANPDGTRSQAFCDGWLNAMAHALGTCVTPTNFEGLLAGTFLGESTVLIGKGALQEKNNQLSAAQAEVERLTAALRRIDAGGNDDWCQRMARDALKEKP